MGLLNAKCTSRVRLDGKTAVITGSSAGIGKETARDFFERGARVVMACRSVERAEAAATDIRSACGRRPGLGELATVQLDLASLGSVRRCAEGLLEREARIDLLVNNAGVMMCPEGRTADGFETQFGTNHLGHFLLTLLLLPKVRRSAPARIVTVSSMAHRLGVIHFEDLNWTTRKYSAMRAYEQSKLANILFSQELARRLEAAGVQGVTTYSLHPGVIRTELGRHLDQTLFPGVQWLWRNVAGWFIKSPEQGAQTTIYCSVDEGCKDESGLYYAECAVAQPAANATGQAEVALRLWEESWRLVGLDDAYDPFRD